MGIPIFFCNESSPGVDYYDDYACIIYPDGGISSGIGYNVSWDSCGR